MILFSAKISDKHRVKLSESFPDQQFIFCEKPEEVWDHLGEAEVLVTFGADVSEAVVRQAPNLTWIACLSAGVDKFPFAVLEEKGITVTNVRGIHKIQMAEYAIHMLLQVYRNAKTVISNEQTGTWDNRVKVQEITGKTMVVLGTGAIGSETARLAQAFRMKTIGVSRSGKVKEHFDKVIQTSSLLQVLPEADFVVSVLPSTKETKGLLRKEHFQTMKNTAVFLNMGRGDVLDEGELLAAVRSGEISHAVLDVFMEEPLPKEHAFWKEANITVTPHISGLSPEYVKRALEIFQTNLSKYEKGEADFVNRVNLTQGY